MDVMSETVVNDECSVKNLMEEKVVAVEDYMKTTLISLTSSLGSDSNDVEKNGYSDDIKGNGIPENAVEEMQKQLTEEKKTAFTAVTNVFAEETANNCMIVSSNGGKKLMYSRSDLEALKSVRVKEQNEKWREICNGLGPDLFCEYDSMGNSVNRKHNTPYHKSHGQPSGRRDKTRMTKTTDVMEITDISNASRSQNWTEDKFISLDEEYSQDNDSDEEYDGILKPAFHVDGEPNFDSGPPEDGMEYLRRVRWEASKIPRVKVAKLDRGKVNNNQSDYMPKIPDIAKCPDHLLPSKEWEDSFLSEFENLRLAFSNSAPSSVSVSDTTSNKPTLTALLAMEPVTRISTLRRHINSFNNSDTLSHDNCVWLFALCASVDTPLDADTCASLRCMLRKCASLRAEKTDADEEVVMLNILATISGKYFKQLDI